MITREDIERIREVLRQIAYLTGPEILMLGHALDKMDEERPLKLVCLPTKKS